MFRFFKKAWDDLSTLERIFYRFWSLVLLFGLWAGLTDKPLPLPQQPSYESVMEYRIREGHWSKEYLRTHFKEYSKSHPNAGYGDDNRTNATKYESLPEYPDYYNPRAGHWEEFLEDLEMRGIDPWDSDAEEIYDLEYGR